MTYTKDKIATRKFDVVIVGAGGSGMRAALQHSHTSAGGNANANGRQMNPHELYSHGAARLPRRARTRGPPPARPSGRAL